MVFTLRGLVCGRLLGLVRFHVFGDHLGKTQNRKIHFVMVQGFLDDVDVKKVVDFEHAMQSSLRSENAELIQKIEENPEYNETVETELQAAIAKFKSSHTW